MEELPEFFYQLVGYQGDRRIVLGIKLLLTVVRPGELRYAEPCHFDLVKGVWNVPPEKVKQLQRLTLLLPKGSVPPFVVPLPKQAMNYWRNSTYRMGLTEQISLHSLRYAFTQEQVDQYLKQGYSEQEALTKTSMD